MQMKVAGATDRQIAETENISHGLVSKDIRKVVGDLARESIGNADEVRTIQMERYNALLLRQWDSAMQGDPAAIDRVLKIMDRINQVNGVIPDKPLINMAIQQNSLQVSQTPITFKIEASNDNADDYIQAPESVPKTEGSNIFPT